jgi:CheY-like chemotaxis protein
MWSLEGSHVATIVLIVGDNALTADVTLTVLSELGPSGLTVPDVTTAVAYLNEHAMDVAAVITDGDLEGELTGAEFARFVMLAWPSVRVAITSRAPEQDNLAAAAQDGIARLTSPILPLQLITFLQNASESLRNAA